MDGDRVADVGEFEFGVHETHGVHPAFDLGIDRLARQQFFDHIDVIEHR